MTRLALIAVAVLGLSGFAVAQPGGPGGPGSGGVPANCTVVEGDFTIDSITPDTVSGSLTGDIDGALAGTVSETQDHAFGPISVTRVQFTGTVTTATGTLEVAGRVLQIALNPMPGSPLPAGTITILKLIVTGGTGDFDGQVGIVAGFNSDLGGMMPVTLDEGYHGVLCTPPAPPTP